MLARHQLWPSVSLSVTGRCPIKTAERIKLIFGMRLHLTCPILFSRNSGMDTIRVGLLSSATLSQTVVTARRLSQTAVNNAHRALLTTLATVATPLLDIDVDSS